ncbi:MAG: hypothetical protein AAFV51_10250 [Pseudomonadota bacterium]
MSIVPLLKLPELGSGGAVAVWAFRATVAGQSDCPALTRGYRDLLGEHGEPALRAIETLVAAIAQDGRRRRVGLAPPGCCCVTADELSIVAVLAAAQAGDRERLTAHLRWIVGRETAGTLGAVCAVAAVFSKAGLPITAPEVVGETWNDASTAAPTHHLVGHA